MGRRTTRSSSRAVRSSKILSPFKRPRPGSSTTTSVGMEVPRRASGRSLTTLSDALDKLVVPPPSRPNTSLGMIQISKDVASNTVNVDLTTTITTDKGKQPAMPSSALNPASSALHALSESLSSLPQIPTQPKLRVAGSRTGLRSSSLGGSGGGGNTEPITRAGPSSGTMNDSGGGVKISSLKILKRCTIFVDVRTEQGDDAGSLFVDMLKGLGAKIMARLGRKCTHIVYKNGLPNTLARYRMLNDPKPVVVGIAWVVECVEKRAMVDEEKFKIDVDMINVAGGYNSKRRRSMLPKHLIPTSPGPDREMTTQDELPPLERARKRRSILPGGQTRLPWR